MGVDCQLIDVSKEENILKLEKYVREKYGRLNVCVNNAGIVGESVVRRRPFRLSASQ